MVTKNGLKPFEKISYIKDENLSEGFKELGVIWMLSARKLRKINLSD